MGNPTLFRTSNPLEWQKVDGIYIDERAVPQVVRGARNDLVAVVGEFERGPTDTPTDVTSPAQLEQLFGGLGPDAAGAFYKGGLALRAKTFSRLRMIRVSNSTQVLATRTFPDGGVPTNVLRVDASSKGVWGNSLTVGIEAATDGVANHFNLRVTRAGKEAELHRNLDLAAVGNGVALPLSSLYVVAVRLAIGNGRPANASQALATGADGTFADGDYTGGPTDPRGIELLKGTELSDVRFAFVAEHHDVQVLQALRDAAEAAGTFMAIVDGDPANTVAQAVTDVANYRSPTGRAVYAFPGPKIFLPEASGGAGGLVTVHGASFAAAAIATLPPGRDPAGVNSEPALVGVRGLSIAALAREDYVTLNEQGILGMQWAPEAGRFRYRSGRTTVIEGSGGVELVADRTMADYLQNSLGEFLATFQNLPITRANKLQIKASISGFLSRQQDVGLLPTRADLLFGTVQLEPFEVDTDSQNTPESEATGQLIVLVRVRLFAPARFLVLATEIGRTVEIRLQEAA